MNSLIDSYNEANSSNISDIDEFEERYNQNDKDAHDVLNDYLKTLSLGLSNLVMIFDPSSIVIGGDINNLLNDKIDMLKKRFIKIIYLQMKIIAV